VPRDLDGPGFAAAQAKIAAFREARGDAASRPRAAAPDGMPVRAQIARAVAAARSERR